MNIHFYCGPSHESWTPKSVETGIGGSEEMTINLAKTFAKRGHIVTVWNKCIGEEGIYDGVAYRNYDDFDVTETDILIIWRSPSLLIKHRLTKVKAKKYLWLHDTVNPLEVLPYLMGYDGIICVSKWHAELYRNFCAPEWRHKIIDSRNAVDESLFDQKVERDPYTIVYGSLYNRGLKYLLEAWPKIKLAVPEAKLRIFYGWQTLEKIMPIEEYKLFKEDMERLMDQEGIMHLDRISHKEVAWEMLHAGIWAYPCINFNEVSCITAMKAQIGGAIPVVIPKAALNETVKFGKKIAMGKDAADIIEKWANALIDVLRDPDGQQAVREVMMEKVKDLFSFDKLAEDWEKIWE